MKAFRIFSWIVIGLSFATLTFVVLRRSQTPPNGEERGAEPQYVSDFSLVDQSSRTVTLADLKGHVWIADFFFTRCTGPCPMLSRRMKQLTDEFASADIRFVSVSVDPEYDRPKVLKEYAERYEADPRWLFLTGDRKVIAELMQKGFSLGLEMAPAGGAAPDITHSVRFGLVDRDGRVIGTFDMTDVDGMRGLRDELRRLKP